MKCYHPLRAYQRANGEIVFTERGRHDYVRSLFLRCGQCIGCRLSRSCAWAIRCVHEASLHESNCFITLTYNKASLPVGSSLHYADFQLFMRRLRKAVAPIKLRFFMCGEYGENLGRPHFHALLFGFGFESDRVAWKRCSTGWLYRSPLLERLWKFGHSSVGTVTFESAAYVARYVVEKVSGAEAIGWYQRLDEDTGEVFPLAPEFCHMSLKPGIGRDWLYLYWPEVSVSGEVIARGKAMPAPKYYDKLMSKLAAFEDIVYRRAVKAALVSSSDRSDERLAVEEVVSRARLSVVKRNSIEGE